MEPDMSAEGGRCAGQKQAGGPVAGRKMRRRRGVARTHEIKVRLATDELAVLRAKAAAQQVSVARLLADGVLVDKQRRVAELGELLREFMRAQAVARNAGTNLNQIAYVANSTGQILPDLEAVGEQVRRTAEALERAADELREAW
jgi:hypothetical protein